MSRCPMMTTQFGRAVANNQTSQTAGPRGPVLMQDNPLIEKMAHFNRERIPERVVHAKGYGAFGKFRVTNDITQYCKAAIFSKVGKETEMMARFSTVGGESGSGDTLRDPRGFALKFYTEEGNWDMVGNNTPIFFVRDPMKFSDFIRTQKREPRSHLKPHWRRWDFWGLSPEATHQVLFLYSDRGTPKSARFMHGFGSHTFSTWNAEGERFWVKWHIQTLQGIQNFLTEDEANTMAGINADYSTKDLFEAIEKGDFPQWKFCMQVMTQQQAKEFKHNPFDLTKVWPHKEYPLIEVGIMELNRNPSNYFADIEQAAFEPSNLVPGIGASPDKMLQNRLLSYPDTHRYRLGVNYHQIPVNQAKGVRHPVATYNRDGLTRVDDNGDGGVDYEPNSFHGPVEAPQYEEPPMPVDGDGMRWASSYAMDDADYFEQPSVFWRKVLDDGARQRLIDNIVGSMYDSPDRIRQRVLENFRKVGDDLADGIIKGLEEKKGVENPSFPTPGMTLPRSGNSHKKH